MRELRISDAELQGIIAPLLRTRLKEAGFAVGTPSDQEPTTFVFPINLDLVGAVAVTREEDGTWWFQQEADPMLFDRLGESMVAHFHAFDTRANRPG